MTTSSKKAQIGRGLLIAGVVLALPAASALARGDLGVALGVAAIPVLLVGGGLSLQRSQTPGSNARLPMLVAVAVAVTCVGAAVLLGPASRGSAQDPAPSPSALPGGSSLAPGPFATGDHSWLPARETVAQEHLAAYDAYVELVGDQQRAAAKVEKLAAEYERALKESKRVTKLYKKEAISYSVYSRGYGRASDVREVYQEALDAEANLRLELSTSRIHLEPDIAP